MRQRASLKRLRASLARKLSSFLRKQASVAARQIAEAKRKLGKAEPGDADIVERILGDLDFSGWAVLVTDIDGMLEDITSDGAYAALIQVGVDVEAKAGVAGVVNAYALDYAKARSASLVGMAYDDLGRLVDNPRAEWAITDSTRDLLRSTVSDAIEQGWSNDRLSDEIADSYAFSSDRAMMVARTETSMASNSGALEGYKASGVVERKEWLTADDDLVDEEDCAPNGDQGPIDLDEEFQSGDLAPPAHPNCRCVLAPVMTTEEE